MHFTATEEQILQAAADATNASVPMGLGWTNATNRTFQPSDFQIHDNSLHLDYVEGRMVKLHVQKLSDTKWKSRFDCDSEYQSWANTYPTHKHLFQNAGITDFQAEDHEKKQCM
jgi:hypothetical protein